MLIELHVLQNFAPANLNRDDTGSPKDCLFGGHRRARISSQSFKRAMRTELRASGLIGPAYLAQRTKRAAAEIGRRLVDAGKPAEVAQRVAGALVGSSIKFDPTDGTTRYLLFLGEGELRAATDLCLRYWDILSAAVAVTGGPTGSAGGAGGRARAQAVSVPAEIRGAFDQVLDGGRAVDLALFGRMIADLPERGVEAASQVAHALSTHRVSTEFDFFTAVDDFRPDAAPAADMLGVIEYNSACFYRYASLDTLQLAQTLRDGALTRQAIVAFMQAFVTALPRSKQHSMAAHNPPSFVMAVVRGSGQWNLANAFLTPVAPRADVNLMQQSIAALSSYWSRLTTMYPTSLRGVWLATTDPEQLQDLAAYRVPSVDQVIERVVEQTLTADAEATSASLDDATEATEATDATEATQRRATGAIDGGVVGG